MPPSPRLTVGVVGATGMVGRELLDLLEQRDFPVKELKAFSSGRAGAKVKFKGKSLPAPAPSRQALSQCELIFLVSSDEVSKQHGERLAAEGRWVIDDSAAFRMDPRVPLVIPEVNADALRQDTRLIAGPNCTMTGLGVAAARLHREIGVRELRVASYQAVSGAGRAALEEFFDETRELARSLKYEGRAPTFLEEPSKSLPRAITFNVVPQVGRIGPDGYTGEENKVAAELRKIWKAPKLKVSATAVRVPTIRGHALAAWLTLAKPITPAKALQLLNRTPGLTLPGADSYPTPRGVGGTGPVQAGRVRQGVGSHELALWIVSDNLLKGAALNSLQIAELLLERGWLQ